MEVYLDYAANTPVDPIVMQVFNDACLKYFANPNSIHSLGKTAKDKIDVASQNILKKLNLENHEIIYTSGASESNNLAIKGVSRSYRENGKHIISTYIEHSSVSGALTHLQNQGYEIDLVQINKDGEINLEHLKELIRKDTILVSICYVDSEVGVLQPINEIKKIVANYPNCFLHIDATQAVGKIDVDFNEVDLITFAPHKFYGLNNSGVLIKNKNIVLEPLINGGVSTNLYRSGTPFTAMVLALEKALFLALENLQKNNDIIKNYNNILNKYFKTFKSVTINSTPKSIPHILNLSVNNIKANDFQQKLDSLGVFVSTKSACSVLNTPSKIVYAISKDKKNARSSWRISLSHLTTSEEIDFFICQFEKAYNNFLKA